MRATYHFPDDSGFACLTFDLDVATSFLMLDDDFSRGYKSTVRGGLASNTFCVQALSLVMLNQSRLGENVFTLETEEARDSWSQIIHEVQGFRRGNIHELEALLGDKVPQKYHILFGGD